MCVDDDMFSVLLTLSTDGACLSFFDPRSFLADGRGDLLLILSIIRRGDFVLLFLSSFDLGDLLLILLSPFILGDLLLFFLSPTGPGDMLERLPLTPTGPGDMLERLPLTPTGPGDRLLLISWCLFSFFFFNLVFASVDLVVFGLFIDFEESSEFGDAGLYATFRLLGLFLVEIGGSNISGFVAPAL